MAHSNIITTRLYTSPCGTLMLGSIGDRLCMCDWTNGKHHEKVERRLRRMLNAEFIKGTTAIIETAAQQLDEFFTGKRKSFEINIILVGTVFQKKVWNALQNIPYGSTISYGELSRRIGCPTSVRAVANANGANAVSLFVPCHRVIGSDNSLTGYGGGIETKCMLLQMERQAGKHLSAL